MDRWSASCAVDPKTDERVASYLRPFTSHSVSRVPFAIDRSYKQYSMQVSLKGESAA